jgi:hypothetical protein
MLKAYFCLAKLMFSQDLHTRRESEIVGDLAGRVNKDSFYPELGGPLSET